MNTKGTFLVRLVLILSLAFASCHREAHSVERAFEQHATNVQVAGEGVVTRVLRDDTEGSPHQRFVLRLTSGQTVLISHNISVAPRIDELETGDMVSFSGEYVWNDQGGLVHRTHHDPRSGQPGGWLKHKDRTYQ